MEHRNQANDISSNNIKPLLALNMIVKDEEHNIANCLQSVVGVVDEIIITDTGSTDNTVEIAKSFGADIFHYQWGDDFATARNKTLSNTKSEWILYLDADERLSSNSAMIIRNLVSNATDDCGGYICRVNNLHKIDDYGNMQGFYPRLFKNYGYPKIQFLGKVHEQISPSIFDLDKSIYPSDIEIEHYGYAISQEELKLKVRRNLSILTKHIIDEPTNGYAWYQLGQTLAQMQLYEQSENALLSAIECKNLSKNIIGTTALTLSNIYCRLGRFEDASLWAETAIQTSRDIIPPLHAKATALLHLNKASEAEKVYIDLKKIQENYKKIRKDFYIQIPDNVIQKGLEEAKSIQKKDDLL